MLAGDCASAIDVHQLCFGRIVEEGRDTRVSKAELPTPNTFFYRALGVQGLLPVALGSTTVGFPIVTAERSESRHAQNTGKPLKFPMIIGSGTC